MIIVETFDLERYRVRYHRHAIRVYHKESGKPRFVHHVRKNDITLAVLEGYLCLGNMRDGEELATITVQSSTAIHLIQTAGSVWIEIHKRRIYSTTVIMINLLQTPVRVAFEKGRVHVSWHSAIRPSCRTLP